MAPRLWALWEVEVGEADLERSVPALERHQEKERTGRVGARYRLTSADTVTVRAGGARYRFGASEPTVSEAVGAVEYQRVGPGGQLWTGRIAREAHPSLLFSNSHYVSRQVYARFETGHRSRLALGAEALHLWNDFPMLTPASPADCESPDASIAGGCHRDDRYLDAEIWAGYRMGEWLQWRVFVSCASRDSNIQGFDYRARVWGVSLQMGG